MDGLLAHDLGLQHLLHGVDLAGLFLLDFPDFAETALPHHVVQTKTELGDGWLVGPHLIDFQTGEWSVDRHVLLPAGRQRSRIGRPLLAFQVITGNGQMAASNMSVQLSTDEIVDGLLFVGLEGDATGLPMSLCSADLGTIKSGHP